MRAAAGGGCSLQLPVSKVRGSTHLHCRPSTYSSTPVVPAMDDAASASALIPPDNFAMVDRGVYRSSFPKKKHFPFLEKIGLRTIVCLVLEDYPEGNLRFLEGIGARLLKFGVAGNKEPFTDISSDVMRSALYAVLDTRNHPVLIHCNKGKHRTGCLVGCYRKVQKWSMTAVFDEYRRFAHPKSLAH
ncbi:hypothetical protein PBRA_005957 [Plasmodiophora brassicae]|uniref:diphosphoinositol-polyphosphate diphosphatase n=1 Tax=Plasmodiophora brassicae TaxID=37360 RepID=A0A0G4IR35_PLABS|nr:hypothetical protein PBRA_005957 [Plasmodiophora brassicae]